MAITRQLWVIAHRWAGLTIALFLIVAGATGALLPFHDELMLASRPGLSAASPPAPGARVLDGTVISERVARQTGGQVTFAPLKIAPDHVATLFVVARAGKPALPYDAIWADPYTGRVKLAFRYAALGDGAQNIMPFLYLVHYSLALGAWGTWAFGIAALIWAIDCFVGFYLTLPARRRGVAAIGPPRASWWARWKPAWRIRRGARGHKLNIDLHRASGLWLWPLLFVFAWSGVGFNLPSVHRPIMQALGASKDYEPPALAKPIDTPAIGLIEAHRVGRRLLAGEAARQGFSVTPVEGFILYQPAAGLYLYGARTSLDPSHEDGRTLLWFSGTDGRLVHFQHPLGQTATDGVMQWFYLLHMAQVFGLPYRIFVSLLGLAVVALSVTGVLIWMKKRSARLLGQRRAPRLCRAARPELVAAE